MEGQVRKLFGEQREDPPGDERTVNPRRKGVVHESARITKRRASKKVPDTLVNANNRGGGDRKRARPRGQGRANRSRKRSQSESDSGGKKDPKCRCRGPSKVHTDEHQNNPQPDWLADSGGSGKKSEGKKKKKKSKTNLSYPDLRQSIKSRKGKKNTKQQLGDWKKKVPKKIGTGGGFYKGPVLYPRETLYMSTQGKQQGKAISTSISKRTGLGVQPKKPSKTARESRWNLAQVCLPGEGPGWPENGARKRERTGNVLSGAAGPGTEVRSDEKMECLKPSERSGPREGGSGGQQG